MKTNFSIVSTLLETAKTARLHQRLIFVFALVIAIQGVSKEWPLLNFQLPPPSSLPRPPVHDSDAAHTMDAELNQMIAYETVKQRYLMIFGVFSLTMTGVQTAVMAVVTAAILGVLKSDTPEISTWIAMNESVRRCTWRLILVSLFLGLIALAVVIPFEIAIIAFSRVGPNQLSYVLDFITLLIAIIYLVFIKYALAYPLVVVKGLGPLAALKRSWQMTRGRFWYVLGCYVFVGTAEHFLTQLRQFEPDTRFTWLNAVENLISGLFACYWIVLAWVMYTRIIEADAEIATSTPAPEVG